MQEVMVSRALRAWESVIEHLQALGKNDVPVLHAPRPVLVISRHAANAAGDALDDIQEMSLGRFDKKFWNKLTSRKVSQRSCA